MPLLSQSYHTVLVHGWGAPNIPELQTCSLGISAWMFYRPSKGLCLQHSASFPHSCSSPFFPTSVSDMFICQSAQAWTIEVHSSNPPPLMPPTQLVSKACLQLPSFSFHWKLWASIAMVLAQALFVTWMTRIASWWSTAYSCPWQSILHTTASISFQNWHAGQSLLVLEVCTYCCVRGKHSHCHFWPWGIFHDTSGRFSWFTSICHTLCPIVSTSPVQPAPKSCWTNIHVKWHRSHLNPNPPIFFLLPKLAIRTSEWLLSLSSSFPSSDGSSSILSGFSLQFSLHILN